MKRLILVSLLLLPLMGLAQDPGTTPNQDVKQVTKLRPSAFLVGGQVGFTKNEGYHNPMPGLYSGFELSKQHVFVRATGGANWARKLVPSNGFEAQGTGRLYLGGSRFKVGPGIEYDKQYTSKWEKSMAFPTAGFALTYPSFLGMFDYYFKGNDKANGVQGAQADLIFPIVKHVRMRLKGGVFNFYEYPKAPREWALQASTGVEFWF